MERRLIIEHRTEDGFTGCMPKPVAYGTVDGKKAVVVNASPGISCLICDARKRCKKNFIEVEEKLPSDVSPFSNS